MNNIFQREKDIKDYYKKKFKQKIFYLKFYNYFYNYLSTVLNSLIIESKNFLYIGTAQYPFLQKLNFKKISVLEVSEDYLNKLKEIKGDSSISELKNEKNLDGINYDKILITSLEYEKDPLFFLKEIRKLISQDGRLFILKYNLWWVLILKILGLFKLRLKRPYQNVISVNFLKNICEHSNFEIVHREDQILLPINIPIISFIVNKIIAKIPIIKFFCFINIFVLRPVLERDNLDNYKISIIVPCKNEERNIQKIVESIPKVGKKIQILFGDDKSEDKTLHEIKKFLTKSEKLEIDYYNAPGICKSENIFMGFDKAEGDIIAILDADNTVRGRELTEFFQLLVSRKYDFINGTRFVYPMSTNAMHKFNYIGNIILSHLFSILLEIKVTDTLCGTKIFFKNDWVKIKKSIRTWGVIDKWGDYDLLLGAKKNFLKITEKPVFYSERIYGETKMKNIFINGARMFYIIIYSFFKFKKI